jgi:16S rRNA (cytidine1402-2'-O)-methyltransferase
VARALLPAVASALILTRFHRFQRFKGFKHPRQAAQDDQDWNAAHCALDATLPGVTEESNLAPGLYLVATPIGNLEDITLRALRVLKQADLIACEDTRHTQKLLNHYGIETRTISYHEHNEAERAEELVGQLANGRSLALVTDAGTPSISDPGYRIVKLAIEQGIPVMPVPGPAAVIAALGASGLPSDSFCFAGFLSPKSGARKRQLESIRSSTRTEIFYEAPHRMEETLAQIVEVLGSSRAIVIAREVTKIHEEFLRGEATKVAEAVKSRGGLKGEITLLIGPAREQTQPSTISIADRVRQLMLDEKLDEKTALKQVAKERGISKSEAYRQLQQRH